MRERRERLSQNEKIMGVAQLVATEAASNAIDGDFAATLAMLACIRAWSQILQDYR